MAIILLIIFFGWPILVALFGVAVGLLGAIGGLGIGLIGAFIGLLVGGIGLLVKGIVGLFTAPAVGLLQIGGGLVSSGVGLLVCIGGVWLVAKVAPSFIRWVVSLFRRLLGIDKRGN